MPSRLCRSLIPFLAAAALAACGGDDVPFIDANGQAIDAPPLDAATDAPTVDAPVDGAIIDAPDIDAPMIDAAQSDAAQIDAAQIDAAQIDAAQFDAPQIDAAPLIDAALPIDAPPQVDAAVPQAGDSCQLAEVVTIAGGLGTASVTASTLGYANDYEPSCTTYPTIGNDRAHSITVAAGARLTANVTPVAGYDAGIYLVGSPASLCDADPIVCLAADDSGGSGTLDGVTFNNATASPVEIFIVIDGYLAGGGDYTLDVTVALPGPGDSCQLAEAVTIAGGFGTASVAATTTAFGNDYDPGCTGYTTGGPDRVHSIVIPVSGRLTASVTPGAGYDAAIYLVGSPASLCDADPITCLAADDSGSTAAVNSVVINNSTAAPLEVFVVIDGIATTGGGYTLDVTVAATAAGDVCGGAETITVTAGTGAATGTTLGYLNDYDLGPSATSCTEYLTDGPDRMHLVTVPGTATLDVVLTPASAYDAAVYLIQGPAAACEMDPIVCLDGADLELAGDPEFATFTNSGTGPVDVLIGIDGSAGLSDGDTYTLDVTITVP